MAKQATCHTCVYAHWDRGVWLRSLGSGWPARPTCGNQPDSYGRMKECPWGTVCRNYRARPSVPRGKGVKTIPLGGGVYAYVDAADYEWLNRWQWRVCNGYAARCENGKRIFMHRAIMKPPRGKFTDHTNGNKLDDTRANLRNVTRQQNIQNQGKHFGTTSIYKGVCRDKRDGKWYVGIKSGGFRKRSGPFKDEIEAARAYDRMAVAVHGEFARLNFPEEWPLKRRRQVHARWLREQARQKGKAAGGRRGNTRTRAKAPVRKAGKNVARNVNRVAKHAPRRTRSPARA